MQDKFINSSYAWLAIYLPSSPASRRPLYTSWWEAWAGCCHGSHILPVGCPWYAFVWLLGKQNGGQACLSSDPASFILDHSCNSVFFYQFFFFPQEATWLDLKHKLKGKAPCCKILTWAPVILFARHWITSHDWVVCRRSSWSGQFLLPLSLSPLEDWGILQNRIRGHRAGRRERGRLRFTLFTSRESLGLISSGTYLVLFLTVRNIQCHILNKLRVLSYQLFSASSHHIST